MSPTTNPREAFDGERLMLVGQVTISWAMLEYGMERILWALLGLDTARGRILTKGLEVRPKHERITQLLGTRKDNTAKNIRHSLKSIQGMSKHRNDIVHGNWVWHHDTGELMLVTTKKPPKKNKDGFYVLREEFEYTPMGLDQMKDLSLTILQVAQEFMDAADALESQQQSPRQPRA